MKRLLSIIAVWLVVGQALGQSQINSGEYFWDTDPGVGNGIPLAISTPSDSINGTFSISATGIAPGVHTLYLRTRNTAGAWSTSASHLVVVTRIDPLPFLAAEYFWDTDPGVGNGLPLGVSMLGDTGLIDQGVIVPIGLALGTHQLHIRVQATNGSWSLFETRTIEVCSQFGPVAAFELLQYGDFISLQNTSLHTDSVAWQFGDGQTDTARSPNHRYTASGEYPLTLYAFNDCGVDTLTQLITVGGIRSVTPGRGGQNGLLTGRVIGYGFEEALAAISFVQSGNPSNVLVPDTLVWLSDQNFYFVQSLIGAEIGAYDVVYTLNGTEMYRKDSAFLVDPMIQPELTVEMAGPSYFRDAEFNDISIIIENTGNVDALMVPVIIEGIPTGEGQIFESFQVLNSEDFGPYQAMYDDFALNSGKDPNQLDKPRIRIPADPISGEEGFEAVAFFITRVPPGKHSFPVAVNLFLENKAFELTAHALSPAIAYTNSANEDSAYALGDCLRALGETVLDAINLFADDVPACVVSLINAIDAASALGNGIFGGKGELTGIKDRLTKLVGGQAGSDSPSAFDATVGTASTTAALMDLVFKCGPLALKTAFPGAALTERLVKWTSQAKKTVNGVNSGITGVSLINNAKAAYEKCFGARGAVTKIIYAVFSRDPNYKSGPGTPTDNFLSDTQDLFYTIEFENVDSATAPAQVVIIRDTLDTTVFDLSTLQFVNYGFDSLSVPILSEDRSFVDIFDLRPGQPNFLKVAGSLDTTVGVIEWVFTTLDTTTLQQTRMALEGFLPPNVNKPEGEGYVSYSISLKPNLSQSTLIRNRSTIIFDTNEPIITNTWENVYDIIPPSSQIKPLAIPPIDTIFTLSWSGSDDLAGIRDYSIWVSMDNEPYTPVIIQSSDTSETFFGEPGRTYRFISVARDSAGNEEALTNQPDVVVSMPTAARIGFDPAYVLGKAYPQPAKNQLHIPFEIPRREPVSIRLVDVIGRPVSASYQSRSYAAGKHEWILELNSLSAGMYTIQFTAGTYQATQKVIIE